MNREQLAGAERKHRPMDPNKAARLRRQFEKADDLHTTCQRCKKQRVGTLEQLKEECDCATTSQ